MIRIVQNLRPRAAIFTGAVLALACSSGTGPAEPGLAPGPGPAPTVAPSPSDADFEILESAVERTSPELSEATKATLTRDNWEFGLDLYAELAAKQGNVFFSPYSISTALAMSYEGARNNTAAEMAGTLHFTLPDDQLHAAFNVLDATLAQRPVTATDERGGLTLSTNNDIWAHIDENKRPLQSYVDALAANYSTSVKLVDFDDEPFARATINEEVERQTSGTVEDLLPEGVIIPGLTLMVLTNTIYLNAAWQTPFDKSATTNRDFTNADGSVSSVPMMHSMESVAYATGDGFQAVQLPYVGGKLAMTVVLPEAGRFEEVENNASVASSLELAFETVPVDLRLPRFETRSSFSLKTAFRALGMADAFDPDAADFTGMRPGGLFIQDIIHQAFISVDEAGTEAGAATAVIFGDEAAPQEPELEFTVDRPFLLFIQDVPTSALLFAGRIAEID